MGQVPEGQSNEPRVGTLIKKLSGTVEVSGDGRGWDHALPIGRSSRDVRRTLPSGLTCSWRVGPEGQAMVQVPLEPDRETIYR